MSMPRYLSQIILYFFLTLLLSGCWSNLELRDAAIVSGVGVEKVSSQRYRMIVEMIGAPTGEENTKTMSHTMLSRVGRTMLDIAREMVRDMKRRILFTHAKSIVLSHTMAREDLYWIFDIWVRDQQPQLSAYLFVTDDPVQDVLRASTAYGSNAEFPLSAGMQNIHFISNYTTHTMREFLRDMYGPVNNGYLPMLHIRHDLSKIPLVEYAGTAVIHHNHMVGQLTTRETQGLVWLLGQEKGGAIDVINPRNHTRQAIELTNEKTTLQMNVVHDHLAAHFFTPS